MMIEQIGLILIIIFGTMAWMAYRSNKASDKSWERMRYELVPTLQRDPSNLSPKNYCSQQLLKRLVPALNHAKSFDDGYYHTMIFKVPQ